MAKKKNIAEESQARSSKKAKSQTSSNSTSQSMRKTPTRKASSHTQATSVRHDNHASRIQFNATHYTAILSVIMIFICVLGIFKWGVMGIIIANAFRLIVGEFYVVMLFVVMLQSMYILLKGHGYRLKWQVALGASLIFCGLATLWHFNTFYQLEPLSQNIYATTWRIYKNEMALLQVRDQLGGGLLGAVFYSTFGYLFGRWGTYLLVLILFMSGITLLFNIPWSRIESGFLSGVNTIRNITRQLFPSYSEVKDVFNEHSLDMIDSEHLSSSHQVISNDEAIDPTVEQREGKMSTDRNQQGSSRSLSKRLNTLDSDLDIDVAFSSHDDFSQSKTRIAVAHADNATPSSYYDRITRPTSLEQSSRDEGQVSQYVDRDYALPRKRRYTLPNHDTNDQAQSVETTPVLDLDYFDQRSDHDAVHHHALNHEEQDIYYNDCDVQPIMTSSAQPQSQPQPQKNVAPRPTERIFNPTSHHEQVNVVGMDDIKSKKERVEQKADHWQSQATQASHLTQDTIDTQLQQGIEGESVSIKPTPTRHQDTHKPYQLPSKNLLTKIPPVDQSEEYERINENIDKLEKTFESFGVKATVVKANLGPSVTKYEIQPAVGVKVSKIVSLTDDIALALAARDVRMEAPIPGKSLIGIEVPNTTSSAVSFWEIIDAGLESPNILEVPLGRDISGAISLADLSKMPHLLMAGATGSGKSVGMNVIIISLLMKAKPDEVKFLMIDPKKVELTMYDGIPHLLAPVVTNPRKAAQALNKVVQEMERRYELFMATSVRNIDGYNEQVDTYNDENGTGYERLPKIVVFIDELADLMMVASNEVETAIIRLAQMARAAGIHMIIATQRPSVDVITGIIKANVPSRLAFAVSSSIDSRTILDSNGAEKLLGRGDMLFQPMGKNKPIRVQGAYISDSEVDKITTFVKSQGEAKYDESMIISDEDDTTDSTSSESEDELFGDAIALLKGLETISISQLQRKFRIGYNRAARLIDDMEAQGYVGPQDGSKPRQVFYQE